jgi:hypothetical protein
MESNFNSAGELSLSQTLKYMKGRKVYNSGSISNLSLNENNN